MSFLLCSMATQNAFTMFLFYSILIQLLFSNVVGLQEARWTADAAAVARHSGSTSSSACHDEPSYRSPLNLPCNRTVCTQWKALDLEQMVDLLRNCPVSCGTDCRSIETFDVTVAFAINASSTALFKPSSTATFEHISAEYMTNYVQSRIDDSHVFLYNVELLQQKRRDRRYLQARARNSSFSLVLSAVFKAIGIGIDEQKFELSIISGIDSDGYESALRRSGDDAFVDVVLSPVHDGFSMYVPKEKDNDGKMPWVALWLLLAGGILAVFFTYHRKRCSCNFSKKVQVEDFSVVTSQAVSPTMSMGQMDVSDLHDEEERYVAPSSSASVAPQDDSIRYHDKHPLAGIIPPMILYENIDEYPHEQTAFGERHDVFPSHRAVASPVLRAQFKTGKVTLDESMVFASPGTSRRVIVAESSKCFHSPCGSIHRGNTGDESVSSFSHNMLKPLPRIQGEYLDATSPPKHRRSFSLEEFSRPPSISGHRDLATPPFKIGDRATLSYPNFNGVEPRGLFETPKNKRQKLSALAFNSEPKLTRAWPGVHDIATSFESHNAYLSRGMSPEVRGETRIIEVPRYGKLGFQFHCDPLGPVVQHVKDYSPLLGKAIKGDRILSIDGWDSHGATHEEVSAMIAKIAIPMRSQSRMMNIVFLRKVSEGGQIANIPSRLAPTLVSLKDQFPCDHEAQAAVASILRKSRYSFPLPQQNDLFASFEEHSLSEKDNVFTYE